MSLFLFNNNVRVTFSAPVADTDNTITFNDPSAPYNLPATPAGGVNGVLTLVDSVVSPTKVEVVTYTGITDNGNGTHTLTGVTRAQEGTTAQDFLVGEFGYQALTRTLLNALKGMALQAPNAVAITGGTINGITSLSVTGSITGNGNLTLTGGSSVGTAYRWRAVDGAVEGLLTCNSAESRVYIGSATGHNVGFLRQGSIIAEVRDTDFRVHAQLFLNSGNYLHHGSFGRIWSTAATQIGQTTQAGLYGPLLSYNAKLDSWWKAIGGGTASAVTIDEGYFSFATSQPVSPNQAITWTSRFVVDPIGNATINGEVLTIGTGTSAIGANVRFKDDGGNSRWLTGILGGANQRNWVLYDIQQSAVRIAVDASTGVVNTNKTVNSEVGFTYDSEVDDGTSGASKAINWPTGHRRRILISANTTLTLNNPGKPCSLILKVVTHSSAGATYTITWPDSIKWAGGVAPDHRTGNSKTHIFSFYFDGTNYYGSAMLDCA